MKLPARVGVGLVTVLFAWGACLGDDAADLKRRVDELEEKLRLAEETADLLEKEVAALRKENLRLKGGEAPADDESDPFRVGAVWKGEGKAGGKTADIAISIAERDGRKFSGGLVVVASNGDKGELPFTGTAPARGNGPVIIQTALVGRARLFFRGRLTNGAIALAFSGTTRLGDEVVGAATLRQKN